MIFYHVDREGTLKPGNSIELSTKYEGFSKETQLYLRDNFPDGISSIGHIYITGCAKYSNPNVFNYVNEGILECVRRIKFTDRPSRFQSICAARTFEAAKAWAVELGSPNAPIRQLECREAIELDATWRDLTANDDGEFAFLFGLLNTTSYNYWKGIKHPQISRLEMLCPLPVKVVG